MNKDQISDVRERINEFLHEMKDDFDASPAELVSQMALDNINLEERDKLSLLVESFNFASESIAYKDVTEMDSKTLIRNLRQMLELKIAEGKVAH